MKVLVTGSRGFIGQNLSQALSKLDYDLTLFDIVDNPSARPKDLSIQNYDWVIHLGAISSTTETDVQKIMDLNLSWSIELLEECIAHDVDMQFASSASVYGARSKKNGSFKETDECRPLNYYAMSKYLFEEYVKKRYCSITVQGFRYFNAYGPNEEHKGSQASPYTQFAKQAKETGVIKIFEGSNRCLRDFIHVDDIINTHVRMMKKHKSGIYNVGTGRARSFLDVAKDVAFLFDARIEVVPFPENLKAHYQYYTQADIDKLESILFDGL